jgi:hypothetical protein
MRLKAGLAMLLTASMLAGCVISPEVHTTSYRRTQPTPVRSLLIVVDDSLFQEAEFVRSGPHFANTLGRTLRDTAGSIPVTVLQIDSEMDQRRLPGTLLSTHATQIMTVRAIRINSSSRSGSDAVWQLTLADVNATLVPDERDPTRTNTRVETRPFYQQRINGTVSKGFDFLVGGVDKNAETMGQAIAARLREDHVLRPDASLSTGAVSAR